MPKSVFITGAARGIGAAMAQTFAAAGYQIGIHYHTSSAMAQTLAHQLRAKGHTAFLFQADIADSRQVEEMLRDARITLGQIDVLINNAGIAQHALVTETSDEMWRRLFAVNCDGPFYACRAVLPHMIARGSGVILNVSSI